MSRYKGEFLLFLAALIWGSAFIFQKMGMDYVGPFTFGFFRFTIGALVLIPIVFVFDGIKKKQGRAAEIPSMKDKTLWTGGVLCGLTQFAAGGLQQIGLIYTTAGKAAFITAMYIAIVPILMLFLRRRVKLITWIGIAVAVFGLYLLCIKEGFSIQLGDGFEMGSALVYAIQLLLIDRYADITEPLRFATLQFLIAGVLSGIVALGFESITLAAIVACAVPILYTGFLEVAAAYTLEIFGQQTTAPAVTAVILSLEAAIGAVCGALFLHEVMTGREITGCILMMAAFLIVQLGGSQKTT